MQSVNVLRSELTRLFFCMKKLIHKQTNSQLIFPNSIQRKSQSSIDWARSRTKNGAKGAVLVRKKYLGSMNWKISKKNKLPGFLKINLNITKQTPQVRRLTAKLLLPQTNLSVYVNLSRNKSCTTSSSSSATCVKQGFTHCICQLVLMKIVRHKTTSYSLNKLTQIGLQYVSQNYKKTILGRFKQLSFRSQLIQ